MTETTGADNAALVTAIDGVAAAITAAATSNGTKIDALTAAVSARGQNAVTALGQIEAQLQGIRTCICNPAGGPEAAALRELALRFPDLPVAQKWSKFQELLAAEIAAQAAANA